ncbi:MAG: hypothetical protein HYT61_02400 [Candidatus Yanofskybacteria bacterium]|nr:hypothetical protein [Candidatus Yanofskybacteria bacterium]
MKKMPFLFFWTWIVLFSVGSGFAKKQEIVNPPKPHGKFKWLLVVRHTPYPEHTHYIYLDKYYIVLEPKNWVWLVPEGRYEMFDVFSNNGIPQVETVEKIDYKFIPLKIPNRFKPFLGTIFLKSKAPKPVNLDGNQSYNIEPATSRFWTKRSKKIKYDPQKAKVVFKIKKTK